MMKVLAHRGAPCEKEENSLEGLTFAAGFGADAVECDVTKLKDGTYVIYHDESLKRLLGLEIATADITYPEMKRLHNEAGRCLYTFDEILTGYHETVPILLHIKMKSLDEDFLSRIRKTKVPFIFGAVTTDVVRSLREIVPGDRILAFMPASSDYPAFFEAGAGNIRLWEQWMEKILPADVKAACPGSEVWIMAKTSDGHNEMSKERFEHCSALGADAVLLDNASEAVKWLL